jgi:ABC-type amino acid transport substrate-binding protein
VQKGTTAALATEELKERWNGNLTIDRYDLTPDSYNSLLNGQSDAVITDSATSVPFTIGNDNVRLLQGDGEAVEQGVEDPPEYYTLTVEDYAIGLPNGSELVEPISDVINEFVETEEYQNIYDKYPTGDAPS